MDVFLNGGNDRYVVKGTVAVPMTVRGGDGNDVIKTGHADDVIDGGAGNDSIWARSGADIVLGGIGADRLYGTAGETS